MVIRTVGKQIVQRKGDWECWRWHPGRDAVLSRAGTCLNIFIGISENVFDVD